MAKRGLSTTDPPLPACHPKHGAGRNLVPPRGSAVELTGRSTACDPPGRPVFLLSRGLIMAIVGFTGGVGAISGSIGGTTFSHNRGGPYARRRAIPTNPGTQQQSDVRATLSQLASRWRDTLSEVQRQAWDTYALNVPLPNAHGEPRNVGGLGMYVRSNVGRDQVPLILVDDAPVTFNLGEYTDPMVDSVVSTLQQATVSFEVADAWTGEDDSAMLVYASRQQNPSINYFKGPYQFAAAIEGDGVTPPTSPALIDLPFPVAIDNKVFLRFVVTRADGRYSSTFRSSGVGI